MKKRSVYLGVLSALLATGGLSAQTAIAQDGDDEFIEEIVTTGSRVPGRVVSDLPVAVDVLTADDMGATGQTEVGRMLQALAPSFNFSSSSISDGTDALRPATLRGLGPDQTLVLVNGKRRHQASLIHINNSVGRGTAGTDMNAIPAAAIKRVEVLRDGAAAQYGSDAIAGVINIHLKDDTDAGLFGVSVGEYTEGDGRTTNFDFYKGFSLGSDGFLGVTVNYRDRERTSRKNPQGVCLYGGCVDTDGNGFLEPAPGNETREVTGPGRDSFRIGDADSEQVAIVINAGMPLGGGELYSFITYSGRDGNSGAFYRNPSSGGAPLDDGENVVVDGFLPEINSETNDQSFTVGHRTEFDDGGTFDVSYSHGRNTIDYVTSNSVNYSFVNALNFGQGLSDADIRAQTPREAFAYGLESSLNTINLDYTTSIGDVFVAIGTELRNDTYTITPGEEYSYRDYDSDENGDPLYPQDSAGGIQAFRGIGPANAVDEERNVISFYGDAEYQVSDRVLLNGALRYDDYDGFGDTTNAKLAANFEITDRFRLRASASTGFRAPSMQQIWFSAIGTQFLGGVQVETGTFRNNSLVAQALGIPELKEEESVSLGIGAVVDITDRWDLQIDYYNITIDDRVVLSNQLGPGLSPALDAALAASGAGGAQFFLNAVDTETKGIDIVSTFAGIDLLGGDLAVTFAANFTDTEITRIFSNSSIIGALPPEVIFGGFQPSVIETWQPEDRVSITSNWVKDNWTANLAIQRYGEYTTVDSGSQTYGAETLVDLRVNYHLTDNLSIFISGINIFDAVPDEVTNSGSRGGSFESAPGRMDMFSPTVFKYSRRSAPFGFNGAYWSIGANYNF